MIIDFCYYYYYFYILLFMIMQVGNSSNALGRLSFGRIEELKRQRPFLRFVVVIVIVIIVKRQLSPPPRPTPTHPPTTPSFFLSHLWMCTLWQNWTPKLCRAFIWKFETQIRQNPFLSSHYLSNCIQFVPKIRWKCPKCKSIIPPKVFSSQFIHKVVRTVQSIKSASVHFYIFFNLFCKLYFLLPFCKL